MRNYVREALILAVAIIALGVTIYSAAIAFRDKDRVVSVRGLAEMEVPANKVIWPISYTEAGNDIPTLYKTVSEKNAVILKFLKDNNVSADPADADDLSALRDKLKQQAEQRRAGRSNVVQLATQDLKVMEG